MSSTQNDPFASPDSVELKGKVTGITRLSKRAKMLMSLLSIAAIVGVIALILTADDDGTAPKPAGDPEAAEKATPKGVEMAKADALGGNIPDGQASAVADRLGVDANLGGGVDVSKLNGASGVVVPGGASAVAAPGVASAPVATPTVPAVGTGPAVAGGETPEQRDARRLKEERDQREKTAITAGMESNLSAEAGQSSAAAQANAQIANAVAQATAALGQGKGGAPGGFIPGHQEQDDVNRQIRKENFLREGGTQSGSTYLQDTLQKPIGKYELKAGWNIPMVLECGINSDLPGQTCARVVENVYDSATGRFLLIPQGTKAVGTYDSRIAVGQSRLLVVWSRLIFPDGSSFVLQGMPGTDSAGNAGFDGDVNNHYGRIFIGAAALSLISAGVQLSQPQQSATANTAPSTQQTLAGALGQQLGQVSSAMINRNMQIQPTITQDPGYRFNITLTKDMLFPAPYRSGR